MKLRKVNKRNNEVISSNNRPEAKINLAILSYPIWCLRDISMGKRYIIRSGFEFWNEPVCTNGGSFITLHNKLYPRAIPITSKAKPEVISFRIPTGTQFKVAFPRYRLLKPCFCLSNAYPLAIGYWPQRK